ncbi:MAG: M23 family metallopeptidase [Candidatus Krumholzibacteriota bacterium]|nr:M23 family metallopeptidase [Candidatus Krumholzibacteriota bacterium]
MTRPARFSPPVSNYTPERINSNFGIRTHPVYHTTEFHHGIDIKGEVGEEVYAVESGSIIFSGKQSSYGKVLIIDHGNRLYSVYAHLSKIFVEKGTSVTTGDVIGKIGLSGNSTGAHLHFEVRIGEKAVNPLDYLKRQ